MGKNKYAVELNTDEMNDSHMGLASRIKAGQNVLELGCSSGYLSKYLKDTLECYVVGVDIDENAIRDAAQYCDIAIVADLDDDAWLDKIDGIQFDVVLCADVLEHLKAPEIMLARLKPFLHSDSYLLASVPNVAHATIRLELLQGHFDYEKLGLLDNTHLHFYTRNSLILMLMQAGYVCSDIAYSIHDVADEAIDLHLAKVGLLASDELREIFHAPDAIAYQFIIKAHPAPAELVQNFPAVISPKPLVSSGVYYGEKQKRIVELEGLLNTEKEQNKTRQEHISQLEDRLANIEQQLAGEIEHNNNHQSNIRELENKVILVEKQLLGELEHNKNHQLNISKLEESVTTLEQQRDAEKQHNINHQLNISKLEESVTTIEQQRDAEKQHNINHQLNISKLEASVTTLEQQRDAEKQHNINHQNSIKAWQETGKELDDALFAMTKDLQNELEKSTQFGTQITQQQEQIAHLQALLAQAISDKQHLEQVLSRVHNKVSYRAVRFVKDVPGNISGALRRQHQQLEQSTTDMEGVAPNVHDYSAWLAAYGELTSHKAEVMKQDIAAWSSVPKIALLMPVYNPGQQNLVNAIESVLQQVYSNFELCIADDASSDVYVREVLSAYAEQDQRIKLCYREQNGHISAASNSALALVEADFVALMDHDDLLSKDALYWVAKTIQENPDAQLIYSDEDKMDMQNTRYAPYFKPDWNPELFLSHNFICHLGVYRTEQVRALGGFDSAYDGAQDYDLALRYIESIKPEHIIHIPKILYHWRAVEGSTANGVHEKPYAEQKIIQTVQAALARRQRKAEVLAHARLPGALRVKYALPEKQPLVSIIIPTRNGFNLLHRCVESIFAKTAYQHYEILIIDNGSDDLVALRYLQRLQENARVSIIRDDSPFNYAALNNKAVTQARGEVIALLNNDLEVINDDWLDEMVSHVVHGEVGAVGAKLYYPDDTIQHAGVIVGLGGVAGHSHKHFPRDNPGFCGRLLLTQNLSAVTAACLLVRKEVFEQVGGFDDQNLSVAFNDVDLCLRIQAHGFDIVWTPYAEMYHHESASRGYEDTPEKQARFSKEVNYMKQHWEQRLLIDPAYNPNLALDREDFSFAWPPT